MRRRENLSTRSSFFFVSPLFFPHPFLSCHFYISPLSSSAVSHLSFSFILLQPPSSVDQESSPYFYEVKVKRDTLPSASKRRAFPFSFFQPNPAMASLRRRARQHSAPGASKLAALLLLLSLVAAEVSVSFVCRVFLLRLKPR